MINYAEGIANINFTGNMVKLDFAVLEPATQSQDAKPILTLSQRIVMPLEAFVQAFQVQEQLIGQLIERGVVVRAPQGVSSTTVTHEPVEVKAIDASTNAVDDTEGVEGTVAAQNPVEVAKNEDNEESGSTSFKNFWKKK